MFEKGKAAVFCVFLERIICKIGFHASSVRWMGSCHGNEKAAKGYRPYDMITAPVAAI